MVLVFVHVWAFFQEMIFDLLDFNDLLAFPAASKHWTLFPIVDVKSFLIKVWIIDSTKVAALATFHLLFWLISIFVLIMLLLLLLSLPLLLSVILLLRLLSDICSYFLLLWRWSLLLRLFGWCTSIIDLWELGHEDIKLRLLQTLIVPR